MLSTILMTVQKGSSEDLSWKIQRTNFVSFNSELLREQVFHSQWFCMQEIAQTFATTRNNQAY